jgi:hypothetical protein
MENIDENLKKILLECKCATRLKLSKIALDTVTYLKEQNVKVSESRIPEYSELFRTINTLTDITIVSAPEGKGVVVKKVPVGQVAPSREQVTDLTKNFKESARVLLDRTLSGNLKDMALASWKLEAVLQALITNIELSLD